MSRSLRALCLTAGAVVPLAALVVWVASPPGAPPPPGGETGSGPREIVVRAHTWGFSPRVVRVRPGETVRFVASSEDMRHGFAIAPLGVNMALYPGREVRSAAVNVSLPEGAYAIQCSVFCGLGHPSMKARLVVGIPPPTAGSAMPWVASLAASALVAAFVIGTFAGRRG